MEEKWKKKGEKEREKREKRIILRSQGRGTLVTGVSQDVGIAVGIVEGQHLGVESLREKEVKNHPKKEIEIMRKGTP